MTRNQAKSEIEKLVHFFEQNIHQLKSQSFNETQARQQLIDPLFDALGWDVHNRGMKPLYLQEVVPEGRVRTNITKEVKEQEVLFETRSGLGKAHREYASILDYIAEDNYKVSFKEAIKKPDYRFRIKGQTKFFVEAKKPFVDLSKSMEAIFQVKRYGFSGRVPVSILTDFEEFRTFDCTHKPQFDKPKLGTIKELDLKYNQYLDQFDLLYDTFSRDSVEAGSLDTLTRKLLKKKTGDFALDKHFLEDLSKWREELARDIAKHPRNRRRLNDYTLNESVQRILDRIVFFRVCEDREIEVENTLLAILQMWQGRPGISLYSLLNELFKQRRSLYNGLLFAPHECEELEVGNDVLLKILEGLNYPFSPYYFNEIGVEILGSIYEKFLGKTIHLTPKTVRVDEKPEVRKAGGVYYTPQYIVNYIVENTVGKLIEGKSPKQVAKLKIIDIACGSGSFLLGAFQKLIDHHVQWYQEHPMDIQTVNGVSDVYKDASDNLHLSARKKRDILVNNLYGVDIDRQAVEVTQMSLYLKVLEGENAETLNPQMTLALKEVYLPPLTDNIKCGNSLIGTDFASQGSLFDDATRQKVNPFDWEIEFREITKNGGFDALIGNPPYGADFSEAESGYLKDRYKTFVWRGESYLAFVEKAILLLKNDGFFGYIVPDTYLNLEFTQSLRLFLLENCEIKEIVSLPRSVFEGVNVDTTLLFARKKEFRQTFHQSDVQVSVFDKKTSIDNLSGASRSFSISTKVWYEQKSFNVQSDVKDSRILATIRQKNKHLAETAEMFYGIKAYQVGKGKPPQTKKVLEDKPFTSERKKDKSFLPFYDGKHIGRYHILWKNNNWLKYGPWLAEPRVPDKYEGQKILIRKIVSSTLIATYVKETSYCNTLLFVLKLKEDTKVSYPFVLAILNSSFIGWYYRKSFQISSEDTFPQIMIRDVLQLPMPSIDFNNSMEKQLYDDLVALVDKMLELQKQLNKASFDSQKEPVERQIAATDKNIDELVYKLYGLTEEEIKIVEGR